MLERLQAARAARPPRLGLEVHAGHGIDYETVEPVAAIPEIVELNIGHFLIGEAIFIGLGPAIQRMRALMDEAARRRGAGVIVGIGSDLSTSAGSRRRSSASASASRTAASPRSSAPARSASPTAPPPTPSASPPRRPAPRRSAPACARGVFWRDMGVVNLRSGQPTMALTGGAAERLAAITPPGMTCFIHLSLTDDPYAQAFVVIEAR